MARKYKYWTVWYVDPSSPDKETGICEGCVFKTKKDAEKSKVDWEEMALENTPGSSYQVVPAMLTRQEAYGLLNSSYDYDLWEDFFDDDDNDE